MKFSIDAANKWFLRREFIKRLEHRLFMMELSQGKLDSLNEWASDNPNAFAQAFTTFVHGLLAQEQEEFLPKAERLPDGELLPVSVAGRGWSFDPRATTYLNPQSVTATQAAEILAESEIGDYVGVLNSPQFFQGKSVFFLNDSTTVAVVALETNGSTAKEIVANLRSRGFGPSLAGKTTAEDMMMSFVADEFDEATNGAPLAFFGTNTEASHFLLLCTKRKIMSETFPLSFQPRKGKLLVAVVARRPEEIACTEFTAS